jgi:hypothetical protein
MIYLQYLRYVLLHKWYVMVECWKEGLYWRGVKHDWSKFLLSEFIPYARFFYGPRHKPIRDETGYYKPTSTGDLGFDFAWLLHQKRNAHHWQWWILPEDDGGIKILPMSDADRREMICDWKGAGKAQGKPDTLAWYQANNKKMQLHPETRQWVEHRLRWSAFDERIEKAVVGKSA